MHVKITNIYTGEERNYQGSPVDVEHSLVYDHPHLYYIRGQGLGLKAQIDRMLAVIGRSQSYMVHIVDEKNSDSTEHSQELYKAIKPDSFSDNEWFGTTPGADASGSIDTDAEENEHPHKSIAKDYKAGVVDSPDIVEPRANGSKHLGGIYPKVIFDKIPSHKGSSSWLVKPYHVGIISRGIPGWAEMTSQALYHASGLSDYHQKVHVDHHLVQHGNEIKKTPMLIHHMEDGYTTLNDASNPLKNKFAKNHREAARKMYLLDYIQGQTDRHQGNIMVHTETGKPMAIDNQASFRTDTAMGHHPHPVDEPDYDNGLLVGSSSPSSFKNSMKWWKENKSTISEAFQKRLGLIKDNEKKQAISRFVQKRMDKLDAAAKDFD